MFIFSIKFFSKKSTASFSVKTPSVLRGFSSKLVILLSSLIFFIFISLYILNSKQQVLELSNQNEQNNIKIEMMYDPTKESTPAQKNEQISSIDEKINAATTDLEKYNYSLQKASVLSSNRSETINVSELTEAQKLLLYVYEGTKNRPEYKNINEMAIWGYVFQFVSNRYHPGVIDGLPSDIQETYFNSLKTTPLDNTQIRQQEVFKGFLSLLDSKFFQNISNDKVLNSYSALIRSMYLDSYKGDLTDDEIMNLVRFIRFDIFEYNLGTYANTSPEKSQRALFTAPTQIAFAKYISSGIGTSTTATFSLPSQDPSNLEQRPLTNDDRLSFLRDTYTSLEKLDGIDPFGKALTISNLKLYELAALQRDGYTEESVTKIIEEMSVQISKHPDLGSLLKGRLEYYASKDGKWARVFQDVFTLAQKSPSLAEFLTNLGVNNY